MAIPRGVYRAATLHLLYEWAQASPIATTTHVAQRSRVGSFPPVIASSSGSGSATAGFASFDAEGLAECFEICCCKCTYLNKVIGVQGGWVENAGEMGGGREAQ